MSERTWECMESGERVSSDGAHLAYDRVAPDTFGEESEYALYADVDGRACEMALRVRLGESPEAVADARLYRLASGWRPAGWEVPADA